jgi:hypothetical protein
MKDKSIFSEDGSFFAAWLVESRGEIETILPGMLHGGRGVHPAAQLNSDLLDHLVSYFLNFSQGASFSTNWAWKVRIVRLVFPTARPFRQMRRDESMRKGTPESLSRGKMRDNNN